MSRLQIVEVPDAVLTTKAEPVSEPDHDMLVLIENMLETMYEAPGIGLAAPQVGVSKRIAVVDTSEEKDDPIRMINPEITWSSEVSEPGEEGCLSLPQVFANVRRPVKIRYRFLNTQWKWEEREAEGLLGRCIQHEIDHLDGILFTDHLSALKRNMVMRKLAKIRRVKARQA